jgi:murein L,D-transpeptidase YafK
MASLVTVSVLLVYGLIKTRDVNTIVSHQSLLQASQLAKKAGLPSPIPRIYLRAFKEESILEIWGAKSDKEPFRKLVEYPIAMISGTIGPKRREGDSQVPEGLYVIDRFNPKSKFHLSLGLNYPNESDRIRSDPDRPGSDIFIHGGKASIGCLAMTDEVIEIIWALATGARDAGQKAIRVDIFPCRLTSKNLAQLTASNPRGEWHALWDELLRAHEAFEKTKIPPNFIVAADGMYIIR